MWRRIQVPAGIRLDNLHRVIQAAMGWQKCHLHAFSANGVQYGRRSSELDFVDETTAVLNVLVKEGAHLDYDYDFGDSWEHRITVERRMTAEADHHYPACVDGAGACPPEDCGGPGGYEDLKRTLQDSDDPEHEDLLRWLGLKTAADFDPATSTCARSTSNCGPSTDEHRPIPRLRLTPTLTPTDVHHGVRRRTSTDGVSDQIRASHHLGLA